MDYEYDFKMRVSDPGYVVEVGTDNLAMYKADELMQTLGLNGIAVTGNVYFYNLQDLRQFMFYWLAAKETELAQ